MKKLTLFSAVLLAVLFVSVGASKKYKFHGIALAKVTLVDPGELYSTYEFSVEEENAIKKAVNNDQALFDEIATYHLEENWPEPLKDFNWRIANGEKMKMFVAYKLCDLPGDRCVLVIPLKKNKKNKDVKFTRDIYFVMKKVAVT